MVACDVRKKCVHEYGVVLNFSVHTIATIWNALLHNLVPSSIFLVSA